MILGVGTDIVDITRIAAALDRYGSRFIQRCFTAAEIEKAERRRASGGHVAVYAKRFAAKEACSKALGTGFRHGVFMKDIGVVNDENGKPIMMLSGGAKARLEQMMPAAKTVRLHVSLTDEAPLAKAFVLIEAADA